MAIRYEIMSHQNPVSAASKTKLSRYVICWRLPPNKTLRPRDEILPKIFNKILTSATDHSLNIHWANLLPSDSTQQSLIAHL